MNEEALVWDELERLARAHLVAEGGTFATETFETVEVSPDVADTLKSALHSSMIGSSQDMTAIVSVPASMPLPAEWLFRLEGSLATPAALEEHLGVDHQTLKSVAALKTAGDDRSAEMVDFVFVTPAMKAQIERLVQDGALDITPLFVKVTQAGPAVQPG